MSLFVYDEHKFLTSVIHLWKIREEGTKGVTFTVTERIKEGEQIFVRYSTRPSMAQLVLDYGIVSGSPGLQHVAIIPALRVGLTAKGVDALEVSHLLPVYVC